MKYTQADEAQLQREIEAGFLEAGVLEASFPIDHPARVEAARARAAEHARYYEWLDTYAASVARLYGIPDHQFASVPYPPDYGIEWPRQVAVEIDNRIGQIIFRAYFDTRVVGVAKPIPPRPRKPRPQRRIWGVLVRIR